MNYCTSIKLASTLSHLAFQDLVRRLVMFSCCLKAFNGALSTWVPALLAPEAAGRHGVEGYLGSPWEWTIPCLLRWCSSYLEPLRSIEFWVQGFPSDVWLPVKQNKMVHGLSFWKGISCLHLQSAWLPCPHGKVKSSGHHSSDVGTWGPCSSQRSYHVALHPHCIIVCPLTKLNSTHRPYPQPYHHVIYIYIYICIYIYR